MLTIRGKKLVGRISSAGFKFISAVSSLQWIIETNKKRPRA
jgi:hypothetical protein